MGRLNPTERQAILDDHVARHGRYDPAVFVAEAASSQHPAHGWFEWDDQSAAGEYRLWQAREFVRGLRIRFTIEMQERNVKGAIEREAPAFLSPVAGRKAGGGYHPVDPNDPEHMRELCRQAAASLGTWLRRYEAALDHAGVTHARVEKLRAALEAASEDAAKAA